MSFIVDVQGFQYKDSDFICKELTLLPVESCSSEIHIFFKFCIKFEHLEKLLQRQANYLTSHVHGLIWEKNKNDEEEYTNLSSLLLQSGIHKKSQIIVKGLQKKRWLEKILPDFSIMNVEDIGCPSLFSLKKENKYHCGKHINNNLSCAYQNAHLIHD